MRWLAGLSVLLAAFVLPAGAEAAQRYAAPSGTGPEAECPQANPCSLNKAIAAAKSNDEVIVTSGTYTLSGQAIMSSEASDVDIHGDFDGPMPTIKGSFIGAVIAAYGPRAHVRYLETVNEAPEYAAGINCTTEGVVERVVARAGGKNASALLQQNNCSARDSLLLASGQGAIALRGSSFFPGHTGVARNVTAIASGAESIGVFARYETAFALPSSYRLDLKNSIAAGDGADILASKGAEGPGNVVVAYSNYDSVKQEAPATVTDAGGNQATPPLFVNPGAGDYREAAGSPTIDAGVADPQIGELDLAGNARTLGAAPDIGAFETVQPAGTPPSAEGDVLSLKVSPELFGAKPSGPPTGGPILKSKPPKGTNVSYVLSAAASVDFAVVKLVRGRRVGSACKPKTRANAAHRRCDMERAMKGSFALDGAAGANAFVFNGRIGGSALKRGRYLLVAAAGRTTRRAPFTIGGLRRKSRRG